MAYIRKEDFIVLVVVSIALGCSAYGKGVSGRSQRHALVSARIIWSKRERGQRSTVMSSLGRAVFSLSRVWSRSFTPGRSLRTSRCRFLGTGGTGGRYTHSVSLPAWCYTAMEPFSVCFYLTKWQTCHGGAGSG